MKRPKLSRFEWIKRETLDRMRSRLASKPRFGQSGFGQAFPAAQGLLPQQNLGYIFNNAQQNWPR